MIERKIQSVLIILLLNLTCFLGVIVTCAYLTASDEIVNTFSVGDVETTIIEDFDEVGELEAGMNIKKEVSVLNTGENNCYVRVLVLMSDSAAHDYATPNFNEDDWEYDDGYYYYKDALAPGEESENLFTNVSISSDVNEEDLKGFNIIVYAESVNVEGGRFI